MDKVINKWNEDKDDVASYCGSFSGETFTLGRRKRGGPNSCSLRSHQNNVDKLQHCFDPAFDQMRNGNEETQKNHHINASEETIISQKAVRFNNSFHHYRFLVLVMAGCGVGSMMLLRYNITVAIVRMVNQTAIYLEEHPNKTMEDFIQEGNVSEGEFNWNNEIQQMLMSWYMVAYSLPQFPMTRLALKLGVKWSNFIALLIMAITNILVPFAAYAGWQWVLALRMLTGIGSSALLPLTLKLIENWLPISQYSMGLTIVHLLTSMTTAANPLMVGYLSHIHWSYSFYVPGLMTIIFSSLWLLLITDHPDENKLISEQELKYICDCSHAQQDKETTGNSSDGTGKKVDDDEVVESEPQAVSVLELFKIPSFYAYMAIWALYCSSYSAFTYILPNYLEQFYKIDIETNGIYCCFIQTGCLIAILLPNQVLKLLKSKWIKFSETKARRLLHIFVCCIVGFTWIYVGQYHTSQIVLFFINRCFHTANDIVVTGTLMINFAQAGLSSTAFSLVNTAGNFSVTILSTVIGYILDSTGQSREAWGWIFKYLGVAQLVMTLLYCTAIKVKPIKFKPSPHKSSSKASNEV